MSGARRTAEDKRKEEAIRQAIQEALAPLKAALVEGAGVSAYYTERWLLAGTIDSPVTHRRNIHFYIGRATDVWLAQAAAVEGAAAIAGLGGAAPAPPPVTEWLATSDGFALMTKYPGHLAQRDEPVPIADAQALLAWVTDHQVRFARCRARDAQGRKVTGLGVRLIENKLRRLGEQHGFRWKVIPPRSARPRKVRVEIGLEEARVQLVVRVKEHDQMLAALSFVLAGLRAMGEDAEMTVWPVPGGGP